MQSAPKCVKIFAGLSSSDPFDYASNEDQRKKDLAATDFFFKSYWLALQPESRRAVWTWPPQKAFVDPAEWKSLNKGGPNGIVTVLRVLAFWRSIVWYKDDGEDVSIALNDVSWVLGELLKDAHGGQLLPSKRRRTRVGS